MSEFEIIGNSYFNLVKELKKSYYIWKLIRTKSIIKIQKWWKNTYVIPRNTSIIKIQKWWKNTYVIPRNTNIIKIQKWWKNTYYMYLHKKLLNNYIEIIKRRNLSIIGKYLFQSNM